MYYIEFCAGQCKKRFTAYLSTASSHNYCSRKQANEFQRLLNIQPESIPSYKVKEKKILTLKDLLISKWTVTF